MRMDSRPPGGVKVKGVGAICAAGRTLEEIFDAILHKRNCFSVDSDFLFPVGRIDEVWIEASSLSLKNWRDAPRLAKIGAIAACEAKRLAGWDKAIDCFFFGTARGWKVDEGVPWPRKFLWTPWTSVPGFISSAIGGSTQILGMQAACASGAVAIIHAAQSIIAGAGRRVMGGGSDAPLSTETIAPLRSMKLLAADSQDGKKVCIPFSIFPRGMTPAEGAAFLALERHDGSWREGEIELCGWAWRSDAGSRLGENGNLIGEVLDQAIEMAGCGYNDIEAVWGHGSGTAANDDGEWQVLETWSRERRNKPLVLLTSKGVTGHAFGATSALEAALACFALKYGWWPPSIIPEKEMRESEYLRVLFYPIQASSSWIVNLSMGFWGETAVLIFKRH
jgi:3-oxoacyl-(acyl-carrier-protein) synthase